VDEKTLTKLEYNRILEKLAANCLSPMGQELAFALRPITDLNEIIRWQEETSEARELQRLEPTLPATGIHDIRAELARVRIGAVLEPEELLRVSETLKAARRLKGFLASRPKYPRLQHWADMLGVFPRLEERIRECISEEGEVADQASPELQRLRRQIGNLQSRIKERLDHYIRSPEFQKYLQDPIVTIRGDRYVIPVKQEYRAQVPGLIHDQSASGATLFIEPMPVVEINNDLKKCRIEEKQEVDRILRELTALIEGVLPDLEVTVDALGRLDFILAKGKLSHQFDGGQPQFNSKGRLSIIQGRHPLISGKVVPVNIHLGRDFEILLITGPNTGGKTVTLKTVGLFTLMAQAGLHLPAETGTEMAVFRHVFSDIGDEQSIEQSLSTFSSHMTNQVRILAECDNSSLVLLDEVGAGTDPAEGAALAQAILEHLLNVGARVIATTHYSELKTFAFNHDRIENASVEFDVETLKPTYRLLIGLPGRSNAFEIAYKLGLDPGLVDRARQFLSQEEVEFSELLGSLVESRRASEEERQQAARGKEEIQQLRRQLEGERSQLQEKEERILDDARNKALGILREARLEAERTLKEIRTARGTAREMRDAARITQEGKERLQEAEAGLAATVPTTTAETPPVTVRPGDHVEIPRLKMRGHVLSEPGPTGEVLIQAGIIKINLPLSDLKLVPEEKPEQRYAGIGSLAAGKTQQISTELDFRGLTVEEALITVDKYLDDAYLAGLPQVYLIHGKGTGTLRAAVKEHLATHPHVSSYRIGGPNEGGMGVTVVKLKTG